MDNKQLKDGVGNLFTQRMRDVSAAGDGSLMRTMFLSSGYPLDYGSGGIFQHCAKSGVMAAGLAANAPIYSFQWPGSLIVLVTRIKINVWTLGVGFAAGLAFFDLFAARAFATQDAGGTAQNFAGETAQMRSSMAASQASIVIAGTAALTPGMRTLDMAPLESRPANAPTTTNVAAGPITLFEKAQGEHPLLLIQHEGFVIQATVPATGTWGFSVTTEWLEMSNDILNGLAIT
jgi:hypothetical protein